MLRRDFQPLYALLDAAREPSVLKVLFESKEQYQSLFEGAQGAQLTHFAPYLVRLAARIAIHRHLSGAGLGQELGRLSSPAPSRSTALRHHFRQFLMVELPDRKQVYFRFYDPRVLRLFLPTCNAEQIPLLFGPIQYYIMEDEKPDTLLRFSNKERGVGRRKFRLTLQEDFAAPGSTADLASAEPPGEGE